MKVFHVSSTHQCVDLLTKALTLWRHNTYDRGLFKEEEFGLGGAMSKRFQEEFDEILNSLINEREEEAKLICFNQLLE